MDGDKQAGLLTNLPAKSTFSPLPASFIFCSPCMKTTFEFRGKSLQS